MTNEITSMAMSEFNMLSGNIGVIGNGSWGTALVKILTDNGHKIHWWLRNDEVVTYMRSRHHNPSYLTSVHFEPDTIFPTSEINSLFAVCNIIIVAVPSAYAVDILQKTNAEQWKGKWIISAIKGILPSENMLLCDFLAQNFDVALSQYAAITGPCHAEEVAGERLSYLTFSSTNKDFAVHCASLFANNYIYTSYNQDIWGTQFAAVLKNIYAVGAGIAHGLGYGDNFLSVYITACYREMYHFLNECYTAYQTQDEAKPDFHTSAYLGDLLVTCYSLHSRNRTFGNMIGKGYSVKAATLEMNMVAEGYNAARGMHIITSQKSLSLPIANSIYQILWEGVSPEASFEALTHNLQ